MSTEAGGASSVPAATLRFIDIFDCARSFGFDAMRLPRSLRVLLENVVAHEGAQSSRILAFSKWLGTSDGFTEIPFRPARILSHDTAGIAVLVDLAALRDKLSSEGRDPQSVNSAVPIDLVIDHSVSVDANGSSTALAENMRLELARNRERYRFLRWAEGAFHNLRIIPPGNGICHQVNMEFLATGIVAAPERERAIMADTVIGTDSHTTMINSLGILGWGVGGIEAEAVATGQPLFINLPRVVGCRLTGKRRKTVSVADIALTIVGRLREFGVVGRIVEFFGDGLDDLEIGDRASIANMAPEYGATCGLFPVDPETVRYLRLTGRAEERVQAVESHARFLGLWRDDTASPQYSDTLTIDLSDIVPQVAGPRRPQERMPLKQAPNSFRTAFPTDRPGKTPGLSDGDVVIAAITSCTHTSNAKELMAAGLLARNARRRNLRSKPWVKASLSPGSRTVADYLGAAGLQTELDALGFHVVGFGCMTCAGNSGPLSEQILARIREDQLKVCAVLSGNRNFEGRIHPDIRAAYLASPALVIAYAIAGTVLTDLTTEPLGTDADGNPVMLDEIWPDESEIARLVETHVNAGVYLRAYDRDAMAQGIWNTVEAPTGAVFPWDAASTHVRRPPFFSDIAGRPKLQDIAKARPLAVLGDHITTDHISPFGQILPGSAAARYLEQRNVSERDWSSYAERRGNHEVLWRSAFANPRLRNKLVPDSTGSVTLDPAGKAISIFDAAQAYRDKGVPTVIVAGKEYGTGSARDWAAKCTQLLGVKAIVAESFERIHRSNLVGVGIVPCQLPAGITADSLNIGNDTEISIEGLNGLNGPLATVRMTLRHADGRMQSVPLICRLDTEAEVAEFREGGMFASAERAAMALSD